MAPLATIFAVLAACANPRADQAAYAQNALIGMPEEALLSCAGVPDRSRSAGGREYFTYQVEQIDSYAYPAYGGGFYRPWYGSRFGYPPLATEIRSRNCEATFILQGGRVSQLNYNTPTGYSGGSRSEEHKSELQSLMRIPYAVFCSTI